MEKLTLKELAPYLPYNLMVLNLHTNVPYQLTGRVIDRVANLNESHKPILRNLSDLTKEIEHDGKTIQAYREINKILNDGTYSSGWNEIEFNEYGNLLIRFGDHRPVYSLNMEAIPVINFLLSCCFDIYGLLDKNLAVPVTENFNPYK